MEGLDYLGAGEGLATQSIVVRVRSIDVPKLRSAVSAGSYGALIEPALTAVDHFPALAIDLTLPIAKQQLEKIGITADLSVANTPPPSRPPSEAKVAFLIGTGAGIILAIGGRFLYNRYAR